MWSSGPTPTQCFTLLQTTNSTSMTMSTGPIAEAGCITPPVRNDLTGFIDRDLRPESSWQLEYTIYVFVRELLRRTIHTFANC